MTLAGGSRAFTPPFSGAAVLYLSNVPDTTPPSAPTNLMAAVITSSQVNLAWTASTDNVGIAGYKIYRDGVQIATTTATSYPNGGLTQSTTYTYQVSAFDAAGNDSPLSTAITVTTLGIDIIPKTNWSLKSVDSQETSCENGAGVNAFDNNNATFWHTKWCGGNPPPPHEIQINLGGNYSIDGFRYLPRQDGEVNGTIGKYEFYVSADGVSWGSAVATGTFANTTTEKEVRFTAKTGRYVRLRALTEVNGNPWTSMAEINVLGRP
jgi:chitodextrinase